MSAVYPGPIEPGEPSRGRRAPLWVVLALTFVGSLGTGGITNGVSFLTKSALEWQPRTNFALLIVLGATYALGAGFAGPVIARLRRWTGLTTRGALLVSLGIVGCVSLLPPVWAWVTGSAQAWTVWVFAAVFAPATGMLWPIVESYLSGGRQAGRLRVAVGRFNITWAVAVALAYVLMGPFVENRPLEVIAGLGVIHLMAMGLAVLLPPEPAAHLEDDDVPVEPNADSVRDARLLRVFRVLLPMTYLLLSLLGPLLPDTTERLRIAYDWRTPVASAWLIVRVGVFVLFERWHGWHGRWWPTWVFGVMTAAGFVLVVLTELASSAASTAVGLVVFVGGLGLFGGGIAGIYLGALYYAMAAAQARVEAGGKHETLIGIGYTLGPIGGLAALWTFGSSEANPGSQTDPGGVLVMAAAGLVVLALLQARSIFSRAGT